MSFSSDIKEELARHEDKPGLEEKTENIKAELAAIIRLNSTVETLSLHSENAQVAKHIYQQLKRLYNATPYIDMHKSSRLKKHVTYTVSIKDEEIIRNISEEACIYPHFKNYITSDTKKGCRKYYMKGAFLAAGSASNPEKSYHLEVYCKNELLSEELCRLMCSFNLSSRIIRRKDCYVVYLKGSDDISDFLNITGAHNSLMQLENIRILKGMRNDVNRIVNCETANLGKTVNASLKQTEAIRKVIDNFGFDNLDPALSEVAELRLKYPDASLSELGQMLTPPLGKSGVNHRLRKLYDIAGVNKASNK